MRSIEENTSENNLDRSKGLEWKALLLLQFQPQFQIIILLSIFIAYHCCMIDFANNYGCPSTETKGYKPTFISIIFCFDIMHAIDILLMMAYRNVQWNEVEILYEKRSFIAVVIDIFSIIPWEAFYITLDGVNIKIAYVIRLRYALRLYRLLYKTKKLRNDVEIHAFIQFLCYAISYTILVTTVACLFYTVLCRSYACDNAYSLNVMFLHINGMLLFEGRLLNLKFFVWCKLCMMSIGLGSFLYFWGTLVSRMILAQTQKYKKREAFRSIERFALSSIKNLDKNLERTCKAYFLLFWRRRHGIIFDNAQISIVPAGLAKEINLDISWDLLKHSHLFREEEIENLHPISSYIKQKLLIPGEVIFKRKQLKSQMVYIVSGVIHILSEQDEETPILSLTGGTCIGESTLLVDYPSTCTVICQSACEVSILTRSDFLKVYAKYPKIYKIFQQRIKDRYTESRKYYNTMLKLVDGMAKNRESLIFKWVKATLQELLNSKKTLKENFSALSLYTENNVVVCTKYLDLLSIIEKTQLVTDAVFLKDTYPCILQSDSFIVTAWNLIIEIFAFLLLIIYPYYASFESNTSTWYFIFSYIILFLWIFDIYIACSTTIKDQDQFVTIEEIAIVRIQNPVFFLDLFAIIPLELVIYAVDNNVQSHTMVLWQFLRLLKCYKIENLFYYSKLSIVEQTYQKFTMYLFFLIYYIAAFLHLYFYRYDVSKSEDPKNVPISTLFYYTSLVSQEITNKGPTIYYSKSQTDYYVMLIQVTPFLFYMYFVSSVVAMQILNQYKELKGRVFVTDLVSMIKFLKMKPHISDLFIRHIQNQLYLNRAINYRSSQQTLKQIYHPLIMQSVNMEKFGVVFKSVPLFSNLPKDVIAEIAGKAYNLIMGPGDIVTCAGQTCNEILIIVEGYCQVISSAENPKIVLTTNSVLSGFEMFAGLPVLRTVIAITHCNFLVLLHLDLMEVLIRHPSILSEFQTAAHLISQNIFTDLTKDNDNESLLKSLTAEKPSSFKHFYFKSDDDSKEGAEFNKIFDELNFFGFTRHLLFRFTIKSDGRFLKYWEIARCVFAFTTAMLTPFIPISTCHRCVWYYILLFLDVTAWVDICIKHYVCYYNKQNIEITHPLKTITHYWKSAFLVDFVGAFPWHMMIPFLKLKNNPNIIVYFKMIKLLQTYRIFRGVAYLNTNLSSSENWLLLKYIPFTILLVNTIGSLTINIHCSFHASINSTETYTNGIICSPAIWLTKSPFIKPLSILRVYLYGIFYAAVVIAGPSKFRLLLNTKDIHQTGILCIIGYLYFIYVTANIVSSHIFRHSESTLHQHTMRNLIKFLSNRRLDPVLRQEVLEHFKYVFKVRQRKNVRKLVNQISSTLEAQLLFNLFGDAFKYSIVFDNVPDTFLRNLLVQMHQENILHKGIICKINDIHDKIYFVAEGRVDVLGADYNHLLFLNKGSLFGNLDDIGLARQKLTIVAKGNVKLLSISNRNFHILINQNIYLRSKYNNLILFNTDYITDVTDETSAPLKVYDVSISLQKSTAWELFITGIVCYLGFLVELYLIIMQDHTVIEMLFMYLCDVCFIINICFNFRLLYKDEHGIVISDKKKIAKRYMKERFGFFFALVCVFPIEIISVFFIKQGKALIVWNYCRTNRLLKICIIMHYLKKTASQISTYIITNMILLGVWISLVLQILTSILIVISCTTPEFNLRPLLTCNWTDVNSTTKLDIYLDQYATILYIFNNTTLMQLPNSSVLIVYFIILMIGLKFYAIEILKKVAAMVQLFLYEKLEYDKTAYELKEYMSWRQTSESLVNKVRVYIHFLWKTKRGQQYPILLEEAPYYLRESVFNSLYGYLLRKHSKFSLCHVDLIRQISSKMRPVTYLYGDCIVIKNDLNETMYFVHEGGVDAIYDEWTYSENVAKTINPGEVFGFEEGLYPHQPHKFTYKANQLTVLVLLRRSDWIFLLDFFPASKQTMLNQ